VPALQYRDKAFVVALQSRKRDEQVPVSCPTAVRTKVYSTKPEKVK
jgi:hypothetical protein